MPRWIRGASAGEIPPGRGKTVDVDGVPIALFHAADGGYHAVSGACPHEDGPLGHGALVRGAVVCPWHGFDFDIRTGACRVAPELSVQVYPVRVDQDDVLIEVP